MFIYILLKRNNALLHMDVFIFVVSWHWNAGGLSGSLDSAYSSG